MLKSQRVRMGMPIRRRLVTVAVLSLLTAALSASALYLAVNLTDTQRQERAHDLIVDEVTEIAQENRSDFDPATSVVGIRGGIVGRPGDIANHIPAEWRPHLKPLAERAAALGKWQDLYVSLNGSKLVARVLPMPDGRLTWAGTAIRPFARLQSWKMLVAALTASSLALIGTALSALFVLNRDAVALQNGLRALATDLSATIPRSSVRELGDIADGISRLAGHLADARSQRERLQRDLARQERLAALGRVTAGVAHEVRNPLASIKLRLDLALGSDEIVPPAIRQAIQHASSEITRLDQLVADLLIVSGRTLGARYPQDVGVLLRARVDALAPWAATHDVRVEAFGQGMALVDTAALARALDNLLRNAVEAAPAGSTVQALVNPGPAEVRLEVRDPGPGVVPDRMGELFEPFFTTKPEGTGLGLALSRAIARAHDGDLTYVREQGVTCFSLVLPSLADQAKGASA